jgi:hypothetical protein
MKPAATEVIQLQKLLERLHGDRLSTLSGMAAEMTRFLQGLTGFRVVDYPVPSPHVGRVIVDGVLQQGKDYEKQARKAVDSIVRFQSAATLSGFISLLNNTPLIQLLSNFGKENTKHDLLNTAQYFASKGIDTYESLREWLMPEENRDAFRGAGKLGPFFRMADKSADYFRKLVGHWDAIAVDKGQKRLLANARLVPFYSTAISYKEKRTILQLTALAMECRPIDLDESIYCYYVATKKMAQTPGVSRSQNTSGLKYCHGCGYQLHMADTFCTRCGVRQH